MGQNPSQSCIDITACNANFIHQMATMDAYEIVLGCDSHYSQGQGGQALSYDTAKVVRIWFY